MDNGEHGGLTMEEGFLQIRLFHTLASTLTRTQTTSARTSAF